ncbi:MAG: NfeD family protein [Hyphomicrobium sp.]
MPAVLEYLVTLGTWNWLIAAAVLIGLETIIPGVHFVWFGFAAALTAALLYLLSALGLGDALSLPIQLLVFVALSVASLFAVRSFGTSAAKAATDTPGLNVRGAQYIGREVVVEHAIVNGRGRVRVDDGVWGAQGEDAPHGAKVVVTGVNGTVLVVENSTE